MPRIPNERVAGSSPTSHRKRATRRGALAAVLTAVGIGWLELQSLGAAALAATTALIVPGTGTSDPAVAHNFESNAYRNFIDPGAPGCTDNSCPGVTFVPVPYDAALWPVISSKGPYASSAKWNTSVASGVANLNALTTEQLAANPDASIIVFGYSQGATVASAEKALLDGLSPADKARMSFVLIANPNRPNGGIIERPVQFGGIPVAEVSFGPPTPTDTGIATRDIAMQYDGISDFPAYPLNPLATANALLGTLLIHPSYLQPKGDAAGGAPKPGAAIYGYPDQAVYTAEQDCGQHPANCQFHGDTTYVTIPSPEGTLPLLYPLRAFGKHTGNTAATEPAAALMEPALRVLIETGYDRSDYATPTPLQFAPPLNPAATAALPADLPAAIDQGIADATAALENPEDQADRTLPAPTALDNLGDFLPLNPVTPALRDLLEPTP